MESNDIYYKVDKKIVENNFWTKSIADKKILVENELFNYTVLKIDDIGKFQITSKKINNLNDLLHYVNDNLSNFEQREKFFSHYTHYLLKIVSAIQGTHIIWWQEDDLSLKENPIIEFNEEGLWNNLKTHTNTEPIHITKFVLDIFKNQFGINNINEISKIKVLKKY
jgi:hypothetical protein